VEGNSGKAQNGVAVPIMWILNDGNVNETCSYYWNGSAPTSYTVKVNSTCDAGGCTTNPTIESLTATVDPGTNFVTGLGPGFRINVSHWANSTSGASDENLMLYTRCQAT
jgi:hypothetical protein